MTYTFSGNEVTFPEGDLIVSKTDLKGRMTYVNKTFCDVSGYYEPELLGQPHAMIRHDFMPRTVFKLLWDTVESGREIFAYVVNRCKNGDYYWVKAHVTPSRDDAGKIIGYHSNRRVPDVSIIKDKITPMYTLVRDVEQQHRNSKDGLKAGMDFFHDHLHKTGLAYDEFILGL